MELETVADLLNALVNTHPDKQALARQIALAINKRELMGETKVAEELHEWRALAEFKG